MLNNLYRELEKYGNSDYYPYHMPGHKRKAPPLWEKEYGILRELFRIDITEIEGFDNLHQAEGILRSVQKEAASLYGAEESFFLVNGSTCGILSAVAGAAGRGERILMARNCHKSVYHAVYLQGLKASYIYPDVIEEYGIADAVSPDAVEEALRKQPDAAAVIITSPTYEGIVSDIGRIADITHRYGKPLLVDEAHGAHFGFHEAFPENAVRQGADIVIHSVHKMLPAMTQTALLHVCGNRIDTERLKRYLRIYQTSSPSYVLMASIDSCMKLMQKEGKRRLGYLWEHRLNLEDQMKCCRNLKLVKIPQNGRYAMKGTDPGKAVISVMNTDMTGELLYRILREKYHLEMEMAADSYVLAMLTIMDDEEGYSRLQQALTEIDKGLTAGGTADISGQAGGKYKVLKAETVTTVAEAMDGEPEWRRLADCIGHTAAEFINLYPPGIPLIVPGERIGEDAVKLINNYLNMKLNVQGVKDGYIKILKDLNKEQKL